MSKTMLLPVKDLTIDLHNFRTVAQRSELEATKAMISISPDYFWGLMESLLDDGYLPTENIIVLEGGDGKKVVKEGNRRIASLKIILGHIKAASLNLPDKLSERIADLSKEWEKENSKIPCTVYKESEANLVDRIVTRTHGKGQKAGRDPWEAVARARHNKIANGAAEPGLDLLEKYLKHGENLTPEQKVRWAGRYNLTVLDEAIKKVAPRFSVNSSPELAKKYPKISYKKSLDEIIYAIGVESLTFTSIRESADFALRFGVPPAASIGGLDQSGKWKIDARFPRNELITRIELIASMRESITLHNLDAEKFFATCVKGLPKKSLIYCDPPYFEKASRLYLNHYDPEDHGRIAKTIQKIKRVKWVVSYDGVAPILEYYSERRKFLYQLQYNASRAYKGSEVFIFSDNTVIPRRSSLPYIAKALRSNSQSLYPPLHA